MSTYKKIGLLLTDITSSGITHDFFAPIIESFKRRIEKDGYQVSFLNTTNHDMTYVEQVEYYGYDGLFVTNIDIITPDVQELFSLDLPTVTIDYKYEGTLSITSDNFGGIQDLVKYIYNSGHRRIAFISGDPESHISQLRLNTFKEICADLGVVQDPEYIKIGKFRNPILMGRFTEELLSLPIPPTCIMYPDDYAAVGGINVLRGRGLEIPKDISYAGYDGVNIVGLFEPSITTVCQDVLTIGAVAGEELIKMIESNTQHSNEEIIVPTKLRKGNTIRQIFAK